MSPRLVIHETPLRGVRVLQRLPVLDRRGSFERLFCRDELADVLAGRQIVQINHTLTVMAGTVRGMHFQHPPFAEAKFVSCIKGKVFDVALDLRRHSTTFLKWHGEVLSPENHKTLLIPEGFAHGYQTLCADCEMLYFHTAPYQPSAEGGCRATDAKLGIAWPLEIRDMSARDLSHPLLSDQYQGLDL